MYQSGKGTNRRHAANYIGHQAHARLNEVVNPAKGRELNALDVDSFQVLYYRRSNSSLACSCQKSIALPSTDYSAVDDNGALPPTIKPVMDMGDDEITIDMNDAMFGSPQMSEYMDDDETIPDFGTHDEEILIGDDDSRSADKTFALSTDCGICYRNGMVPGYELYGHDRKVLTSGMISDINGYQVDAMQNPDRIIKIDSAMTSFVEFVIDVPKYFKHMRYSVRNNGRQIDDEELWLPTAHPQMLTAAAVRAAAGSQIAIQVRADVFTHVVIEFDLGVDPVLCALAQDTKATDWTMFDTLGNVSLILPNTIASVETSDVVYVPKRNHTFKLSDVTYLRTAQNHNLDWQAQARVLQPQEALKHIYKSYILR